MKTIQVDEDSYHRTLALTDRKVKNMNLSNKIHSVGGAVEGNDKIEKNDGNKSLSPQTNPETICLPVRDTITKATKQLQAILGS